MQIIHLVFQCVLKRADYEVENNGPIVPRAKVPRNFNAPGGQRIFVNETPQTYVIEHIDSAELSTENDAPEEAGYKPSPDEVEQQLNNEADNSNPHENHESSISDDGSHHDHENHEEDEDQMLQQL